MKRVWSHSRGLMPCCNSNLLFLFFLYVDDMCELMSSLPENVVYTCTNCTESHPAEWRTVLEKEIQRSMRQVLTALFNSRTSTHLLRYRQVSYHLQSQLPTALFPLYTLTLPIVSGCYEATWAQPRDRRKPSLTTFPRGSWSPCVNGGLSTKRFAARFRVCGEENGFWML